MPKQQIEADIAASTRTRHYHGAFVVGASPVVVFSTRARDERAVGLAIGSGAARALAGLMSPVQAQQLALALNRAASAAGRTA